MPMPYIVDIHGALIYGRDGIRNILIRDIAVDRTHFAEGLGMPRTVL
jgi:hypothetical protein